MEIKMDLTMEAIMVILMDTIKDRVMLTRMSKIAREELVHFEQVMRIMKKRDIQYNYIEKLLN